MMMVAWRELNSCVVPANMTQVDIGCSVFLHLLTSSGVRTLVLLRCQSVMCTRVCLVFTLITYNPTMLLTCMMAALRCRGCLLQQQPLSARLQLACQLAAESYMHHEITLHNKVVPAMEQLWPHFRSCKARSLSLMA
jgi:hypothetical protein